MQRRDYKMDTYSFNRTIPIFGQADVIVVGGGPAGVSAAIASARSGLHVILTEQVGQLGGMGTLGNVSIFMGVGNVTGIYREFIAEMVPNHLPTSQTESISPQYNPFQFRHYLNEKMEKEKVEILFHTSFVGVIKISDRVTGIIVNTREGLKALEAKIVIDCSGDGRVAIDAGASYTTGRTSDGLTQPMTLMFMMQDTGKPIKQVLPEGCYLYKEVSDLPQGRLLFWEQCDDGLLLVNMTRVKGNGANVKDVSYAEKEALRQVFSVANYLQRNGFQNYALSHIPGQVGVRETNQIVGHYTLTEDDLTLNRRFVDVVAQTNYEIDIHSPDGKSGTDERHIKGYDIPYRCLVPKGINGLLVAGRAISATHVAMSSMRVQATCCAMGQAAGVAASLAIEKGQELVDIHIPSMHEKLFEQGVWFTK
jgi:hypothetical protein